MYSTEEGLEATFQIVNFIAWSPDPSQVLKLVDSQWQMNFQYVVTSNFL